MNPRIVSFLNAIKRPNNAEEIEALRDEVTRQDLPALVKIYWSLNSWEHKCSVINLVQDYLDPCTREIMLDWLHAPADKNGDYFELTKAIALCHLDGNLKNFDAYYKDRSLIAKRVQHYLSQR